MKSMRIALYNYRKLGNFYVKIIHVLNIHVDLFMVPTKIFQHEYISTRTFIIIVLLILCMSNNLYYLAIYHYLYSLTM